MKVYRDFFMIWRLKGLERQSDFVPVPSTFSLLTLMFLRAQQYYRKMSFWELLPLSFDIHPLTIKAIDSIFKIDFKIVI